MPGKAFKGLGGLRVASFESRRAEEMARLIRKQGGEPLQAPSMEEVRLTDQTEALGFGERLTAGACDVLILLTGVGTRALVEVLSTRWPRREVLRALGETALVCRGPKPVAALREVGLRPALTVPEPNTWRDVLAALDRDLSVFGKCVAVQEYGVRNPELLDGLDERGAKVFPVPVYAWKLPSDTTPLRRAVARTIAGEVDVALFTSAVQVDHLFRVARAENPEDALRDALTGNVLVASIGPVTSEALDRRGLAPDFTPEHAKMGHLISSLARCARPLLQKKRAT